LGYELSFKLQHPATLHQTPPRAEHIAAAISDRYAAPGVTVPDPPQAQRQTVCLCIKGLFDLERLKSLPEVLETYRRTGYRAYLHHSLFYLFLNQRYDGCREIRRM